MAKEKRKVIITVAPSSNFHGRDVCPNLPVQPEEIAAAAYDCLNAGASIVHFHARDKQEIPTNDPAVVCDIISALKAKVPSMILQPSIAPANRPDRINTADDGLVVLDTVVAQGLKTEMCSFDCGPSVAPSPCPDLEGPVRVVGWYRDWLVEAMKKIVGYGIKPELEVASPAEIETALDYLVAPGILENPSFTLLMGMKVNQAAVSWKPEHLMYEAHMLPPGTNWGALGVGPAQYPANVMSMIMGGQCRVGFEDNIYYRKGEKATSNAQLVERMVNVAKDLGLDIATPDEAREILKIK